MKDTPNVITLGQLTKRYPTFRIDEMADDFAIARQRFDGHIQFFQHPCRFDGYMIVL